MTTGQCVLVGIAAWILFSFVAGIAIGKALKRWAA